MTLGSASNDDPALASGNTRLGGTWQMPMFWIGAAALALVLCLRYGPWGGGSSPEALLADALTALDAGDFDRCEALARHGLARTPSGSHSRLDGDLRFALGSAYLGQAGHPGPSAVRNALAQAPLGGGPAEPTEVYDKLERARLYLREANQRGVSDALRPRLTYRLILLDYASGTPPAKIVACLSENLEANAADRVEGLGLLAELYLAMTPPDLDAALQASERLLAQPALSDPNRVRLRHAELLLRMGRSEAARQIAQRIPDAAPEYQQAQHLLGRSWMQDGDWNAAAAVWRNALKIEPSAEAGYHLGGCYLRLAQPERAARCWEDVVRNYPRTSEAIAAGFQLAELMIEAGRDDEALERFAATLPNVSLPYENPLLDLADVRAILDRCGDHWFQTGKYDHARRLARISTRLADGIAAELRFAQASRAAGNRCLELHEYAVGPEAERLLEKARRYFAEAGEAFEACAAKASDKANLTTKGTSGTVPPYPEWLWHAADCYLRGRHYTRAAAVLERYLTLDLPEQRRFDAMVGLSEAHRALRRTDQALQLLEQVLRKPSVAPTRARYLLALVLLDQGKYEEAEATLREILAAPAGGPGTPIGQAIGAEPKEVQQSYFTLGYVLYRQGRFLDAAGYLEKAIEKKARDPQLLQARYWLGESFRQAARQQEANASAADTEAARRYSRMKRTEYLDQAYAHFWALAAELTKRREERPLTDAEKTLLRESRFGIADTLFYLGRFEESVSIYEALAGSSPLRGENLRALMELTHLRLTLRQIEEARDAIDRAEAVLGELADGDLELTHMNRKKWRAWIDGARKLCR